MSMANPLGRFLLLWDHADSAWMTDRGDEDRMRTCRQFAPDECCRQPVGWSRDMHRTEHSRSSNYPRNASIITDEMRWTEHNAENKQWVRSLLELEGDRTPGTADLTFMFRHHVLQTRVILRTEHTKTEHGESLLSSDLIFSSRTKTEQAS